MKTQLQCEEYSMKIKSLIINNNEYLFKTLEQLVEMLKDDNYEIKLDIRKKGKITRNKVIL